MVHEVGLSDPWGLFQPLWQLAEEKILFSHHLNTSGSFSENSLMAGIFIHHLDFKEKCPQKQPDSSFTKSLLLLELASDTSLIPNLGKFAVALWQFFLLLQDQASSGEDINWADIKQLKLILLNCAGEPHRLETKTMDTKGGLTGILQLSPKCSERRIFLGKDKFWNSQAKREGCERFDHCCQGAQFRAETHGLLFTSFLWKIQREEQEYNFVRMKIEG